MLVCISTTEASFRQKRRCHDAMLISRCLFVCSSETDGQGKCLWSSVRKKWPRLDCDITCHILSYWVMLLQCCGTFFHAAARRSLASLLRSWELPRSRWACHRGRLRRCVGNLAPSNWIRVAGPEKTASRRCSESKSLGRSPRMTKGKPGKQRAPNKGHLASLPWREIRWEINFLPLLHFYTKSPVAKFQRIGAA